MAVTRTVSVDDIASAAMRKAGILASDEAASADMIVNAVEELERMLKSWQADGANLWVYASQTVTLTTAASYTLDPVRPMELTSVRLDDGSSEMPMERLTRQGYDDLPIKTSTGRPTCFYYDRQREAAKLYVWPVLAAAAGETLVITYIRETEDIELADTVDLPAEGYDAAVYCLADRLADEYGVTNMAIKQRADTLYEKMLAFDREGSVFFAIDDY